MEDKRKILDMVAEGKITAKEAARLLEAMNAKSVGKGKKLNIQIIEEGQDKPKLNIAIPIGLAKFGLKFIPKNAKIDASMGNTNFDMSAIDWKEIFEMATSGETGELFYMDVEEEGKTITIRIFVE